MRYRSLLLFMPMALAGAADEGLAHLVYLDDRLELHPHVSASARYDSNAIAAAETPADEFNLIAGLGLGLKYVWSEATTVTADARADLVYDVSPDAGYHTQGAGDIRLRHLTQRGSADVGALFSRSDDPDLQTGERLLVDRWSADANGSLTGLVHRLSGGLAFQRTDYLQASRDFGVDDRDSNTATLTLGYGLRLDDGDELTLRLVGDRQVYDQTTINQDSSSGSALVGWNRQISEAIGLSIEAGVEYRHYEASATQPATDVVSPTWLVAGNTTTATAKTWSLTMSGGLQDSVSGNPALESRLALGYGQPLTESWSLSCSATGYELEDVASVAGQPKDQRWTVGGVLGSAYTFRPGLSCEASGGYEYSDSHIEGTYDRWTVRAGVNAGF